MDMIARKGYDFKKNNLQADSRDCDGGDKKTKQTKAKITLALQADSRGAQVLQLPSSLVDATWLVGFETTP